MRVTRQIVLGVGADEIDEDVVRGGTMTTHRKLKRAENISEHAIVVHAARTTTYRRSSQL